MYYTVHRQLGEALRRGHSRLVTVSTDCPLADIVLRQRRFSAGPRPQRPIGLEGPVPVAPARQPQHAARAAPDQRASSPRSQPLAAAPSRWKEWEQWRRLQISRRRSSTRRCRRRATWTSTSSTATPSGLARAWSWVRAAGFPPPPLRPAAQANTRRLAHVFLCTAVPVRRQHLQARARREPRAAGGGRGAG